MNPDKKEATTAGASGSKAAFRSASVKGLFGGGPSAATASTAESSNAPSLGTSRTESKDDSTTEPGPKTADSFKSAADGAAEPKAAGATKSVAEESSKPKENAELDLVFVVDNTGSMSSWIKSAQDNVQKIIHDIVIAEACDVRFALVSYRDHPPQDSTFVTQTHDFTQNVSDMQRWVDGMRAQGGGDGPEAVADGLLDALDLSYRPNSTKVIVLIADAPPHGLGLNHGDGFPCGCPLGLDPLDIVRRMAGRGITVYSVICGNFEGQAFYQGIAQMTGGQYIPISSAHLLAGVIVGGAQEEISLERLMEDAHRTAEAEEQAAGRELDEEELATRLQQMFQERGTRTRQTRFGGTDLPAFEASAAHYSAAPTLADVRGTRSRAHLDYGGYGGGIDAAPSAAGHSFAAEEAAEVSYSQCARIATRSKARRAWGR